MSLGCFSKEILNGLSKDKKLQDAAREDVVQFLTDGVKKALQESEKKLEEYSVQYFEFVEGEKLRKIDL